MYQETSREDLFNAELKARLSILTPNFVAIREAMGITSEVGLGFFPQLHEKYCLGLLPLLERRGNSGRLYYPTPGLFFGGDYIPMTRQDRTHMVLMPDDNIEKPSIVSIYQKAPEGIQETVEEKLLNAPDIVYEGIMAHELAHMFEGRIQPPGFVANFLDQRMTTIEDMSVDPQRQGQVLTEYDLTHEAAMDTVAAMFGFRQQVLAKLVYLLECLKTYPGANNRGYSLFKTAGNAIEELELRIKEVTRSVPA